MISILGGSSTYGAIAGKTITLEGTGDFHYDESLVDLDVGKIRSISFSYWNMK